MLFKSFWSSKNLLQKVLGGVQGQSPWLINCNLKYRLNRYIVFY